MPNILRVTTPPAGLDNNVKNNPLTTNEKQIQNPVDPGKIVRPDGRGDAGDSQQTKLGLNAQSNFGNFIQQINEAPQLTQLFSTLFLQGMGNMVEAGIGPDLAEEIAKFMEMVKMNDAQLLEHLKDQASGAVRYTGTFYDMLRQVMNETQSVELKAGILDFLKQINDMSSGPHLLENIWGNLDTISKYMMRSDREMVRQLMEQLDMKALPGDTKQNAAFLKKEAIPMLAEYIAKTRDFGTIRDLIGVLTSNTARYENGNMDKLIDSFARLMDFQGFRAKFHGIDPKTLPQILQHADHEKAAKESAWTERFLHMVESGIKGEAGLENKQVFQNLMNAVLLNESVYMPVLHLMLPIELNGQTMFSEMWIDPDDESGAADGEGRRTKLLLKFDIKDLGFFDVVILYGNERMDMDMYLSYPEILEDKEKEIHSALESIMANNGISFRSLVLEKASEPVAISQVFPKIFERKNSINVTI